jgi:filamentous hemagglutinin
MLWAADKALSGTSFGEKVAQYQAHLEGVLGKAIAEGVEGTELEVEYDSDAYLLGGGGLIATLLVGTVVSGSSSKVIKVKESGSPATNHNPHSGQTDAEAGYPLPDRPVKIPSSVKNETGGTLIFHDNSGGHAVQKHVGKTDVQLVERFNAEPHIKASSTFNDLAIADKAVGEAFSINRAGIDAWMSGGSNNKYSFTQELGYEIGRVISNGASTVSSSSKVTVFLEKDPSMPKGFIIVTAYPE